MQCLTETFKPKITESNSNKYESHDTYTNKKYHRPIPIILFPKQDMVYGVS